MLDDKATRMVSANGLELACQVSGPADAPAIVLIRGLGTQLIEWSPVLIETLVAGGLKVVIFDNRDVGLSSKLEQDYALSDMADGVVELKACAREPGHRPPVAALQLEGGLVVFDRLAFAQVLA